LDAVEIKVTIRPDQELRAERAMQVNEDTAAVRLTYFFDTPDLDLFKASVALRARLVKGDWPARASSER
jgi:inorganic triphosphatase YgiF